jgi:ATP-dependent RNA helicase DeaD
MEWVLFRVNVGRVRNAEPRWLVPLQCKRGHITRHEIGAFRIEERSTTVEIAAPAAERFAAAVQRPSADPRDKNVRIEKFDPRRAAGRGRA